MMMMYIVVTNPVTRKDFAALAAEQLAVSRRTAYNYIQVSRRDNKGRFLSGKLYTIKRQGFEMVGSENGFPQNTN